MTDDDDMAALYALGLLDGAAYEAAVRRAETDPAFREAAAAFETGLAGFATALSPVAPSADLFAGIEARLDARAAHPGRTVRADEGRWRPEADGIRVKLLSVDRERNRKTLLLDVDPGAVLPEHDHGDEEDLYVISGDLAFGDLVLGPGDFHQSPRGSHHLRAFSRYGCRCLVTCDL